MSEIGFKIHGKFYPLIVPDDWTGHETRLTRRIAGEPLGRLIQKGDHYMINLAYAAAAWWRENPLASEDDAFNAIGALTAKDLEFIGGQPEGDARPPDETPSEDSSESTEQSSESTPENTDPPTSGTPGSPTGSTSGRQPASES